MESEVKDKIFKVRLKEYRIHITIWYTKCKRVSVNPYRIDKNN